MRFKYILFVLICAFLGFCSGMIISSFGDTRSDGFAPAASALGNGLLGSVVGLLVGFITVRRLNTVLFHRIFIIIVIVFGALCSWVFYRIRVGG